MQSTSVKVGDLVKANIRSEWRRGLGLVVSDADDKYPHEPSQWFRVNWFKRPSDRMFASFDDYHQDELILLSSVH